MAVLAKHLPFYRLFSLSLPLRNFDHHGFEIVFVE